MDSLALTCKAMTLDGLLTLLTLLVAIYALSPRVTRLRARLGIGLQIPLAIIAFLLVLYVQFNTQVALLCTTGRVCEWSHSLHSFIGDLFTPPELSFIIALVWSGLAYAVHKFFSGPQAPSSLPTVSKIVSDLIYEQRHAELIDLVEPRLPFIDRAIRRSLRLQKLHDRIRSLKGEDLGQSLHRDKKRRESPIRACITKMRRHLGNLETVIPSQRRVETHAGDIVRALCRSENLRNYVIKERPYFALSILPMWRHDGVKNFSDAYFTGLISDINSILYQEFKENSRYYPARTRPLEGNRILGVLFDDATVAKGLGVWEPIGNYMLKLLQPDESPDPQFTANLNMRPANSEDERWENPLFAGMYFFEVMVTYAAKQKVQDHMSLYYFTDIIGGLEKIYDPSIPDEGEFPSKAARLIYEAINVLQNWILLVKDLPKDSPHMNSTVLAKCADHSGDRQTYRAFGDNGNIPVSAANTLGFVLRKIVLSERISKRFKVDIYEIVVKTVQKLEDPWRSLLIQCTVHGGSGQLCGEYGRHLRILHKQIDHVHLESAVHDLKDALGHRYGHE